MPFAARAPITNTGTAMSTAELDPMAFKLRDAASYDSVTQTFDRFTQRFSEPLARELIALARLRPGERVLDIGTGTGVVALAASREVRPTGHVVGVDLSEGMLRTATDRAGAAGLLDSIEFSQMDAEALDISDGSFDVVLSLFALLHFPNPVKALSEMYRVLRPGGRLVVAVGSGPPKASWAGFKRAASRVADRLLLRPRLAAPDFLLQLLDQHTPAPPITEVTTWSRDRTSRRRLVPQMAREAGFVGARGRWAGDVAELRTPEEFWDLQVTFSSVGRKRLAEATDATVGAIRNEFIARCRRVLDSGGQLVYPYGAFYLSGRKPETPARAAEN